MHQHQYAKIAEHPLRNVFRNMVTDSRDLPTKSELRAAIDEALPEGTEPKLKDALFTKAIELAKAAAQDRGSWFDLRGKADYLVLEVIEGLEAAERILPVEVEDTTPIDVGDVVDNMDNPAERNLRAIVESRKADELEANRIRQMGGQS